MGVCYIVGAGVLYGKPAPKDGDLVIAADGGYDHLSALGIVPDLVIGDMDSVSAEHIGIQTIRYPKKKDKTDMHLAYLIGREKGYREFVVYGGTGGRPDHTFANYSLLFLAKNNGDSITVVDEKYDIFALKNEKIEILDRCGCTLSVFAFSGRAEGVCIDGCEYNVSDGVLECDFALGVSNEITLDTASVAVSCGRLLVMVSR